MRQLWLVCLLAACDDAVVIEVHPAPGVATDTVQLYIGLGTCDDCPGIQPPRSPEILPGRVLYREAANPNVRTARVEGGVATFRIEASAALDRFDLAVAVDANGASAAIIQHLPLDQAGRYRVDLLPARSQLGVKPATADGNFVALWKQPLGPLPCMGFERWAGGALEGERIFIVPEADLDCDGRTAMTECAPYGFDAVGVPALADTTCTTIAPISANVEVCKLGGPTCDETTGAPRSCAPSEYCLPSVYCDLDNLACTLPADRDRCLFDTDATPEAVLDCTIAFAPASDGTHDDVCETGKLAKFSIRPTANTANPITCLGPDRDLLLARPTTGELAFTETIERTSHDTANRAWTLATRLHWEGGCAYKLEAQGDKAPGVTKPDFAPTFAQFWVTQSGGGLRKILAPIVLHYTNDCSVPSTCRLTIDPDDSLANCLR